MQQQRVDDGEYGGVCANAQTQGEHGESGEDRRFPHAAPAIAEIAQDAGPALSGSHIVNHDNHYIHKSFANAIVVRYGREGRPGAPFWAGSLSGFSSPRSMTTSRDQLAVLLRCDPLLPVTGPISAWIQSGSAEEQDEKAGADQNQHDAMVEIVAGRAWAATCSEGRDTQ